MCPSGVPQTALFPERVAPPPQVTEPVVPHSHLREGGRQERLGLLHRGGEGFPQGKHRDFRQDDFSEWTGG